jgi:hypothetical protein
VPPDSSKATITQVLKTKICPLNALSFPLKIYHFIRGGIPIGNRLKTKPRNQETTIRNNSFPEENFHFFAENPVKKKIN